MNTTKTREILTVDKISSDDVQDMPHDPIRDLTHRVMEEQVARVWPNPSPALNGILGVKGDEQIPVAWEVKPVKTMEHLLWTVQVNMGYGLQVIAPKPTVKGTVSVKLYHLASGVEMTMHGETDPVERSGHHRPPHPP